MINTSFEKFASEYDKHVGDSGDYIHQKVIDPALFEVIGTVQGKTIYEIGCGNGYFARKLINLGAKEMWASDISASLIRIAKSKYQRKGIKYLIRDGMNFNKIPVNYFDLIVINMAIHYFQDLDCLFSLISKSLKIGGRFVFTTDHPFRLLAYFDIGKINDIEELVDDGRKYTKETFGDFPSHWNKSKLRVYKRPFSYYINLLSKHDLLVDQLIELPTKVLINNKTLEKFHSPIPFKIALGSRKI